MIMTYPYRVKYDGKYYAPGEPVEVKEEKQKTEDKEDTDGRTTKK